jgi:hypothetical protein
MDEVGVDDLFDQLVVELGDAEDRARYAAASELIRSDLFVQQLWMVEDPPSTRSRCARAARASRPAR